MYVNVFSIDAVDQVEQSFDTHFYMKLSWVVKVHVKDRESNLILNEKEACVDPEVLANFDFETWEVIEA